MVGQKNGTKIGGTKVQKAHGRIKIGRTQVGVTKMNRTKSGGLTSSSKKVMVEQKSGTKGGGDHDLFALTCSTYLCSMFLLHHDLFALKLVGSSPLFDPLILVLLILVPLICVPHFCSASHLCVIFTKLNIV